MRIILDLQALQTGSRDRGIGRYSASLTRALLEAGDGHEFWILLNNQDPSDAIRVRALFEGLIDSSRILAFAVPRGALGIHSGRAWKVRAAELMRTHVLAEMSPDVVLTMSLFEFDAATSIEPEARRGYGAAMILYDLIPLAEPEVHLGHALLRRWYDRKLESLRNADLLLAISEHSARDAIERLTLDPARCVNIAAGGDSMPVRQSGRGHADPRGFGSVLHVGGFEPRKNVDKLIGAYARLPPALRRAHPLLLAGPVTDIDRKRLSRTAKRLGLGRSEVGFTGFVPDDVLCDLYRNCRLFVFPSRNEGCGLPPLEAMHCGAAVIAADRASLPELIEISEALFDPDDLGAFAALLEKGLTDAGFRERLIANAAAQSGRFTWEKSARRVLDALAGAWQRRRGGDGGGDPPSGPGSDGTAAPAAARDHYARLIDGIGGIEGIAMAGEPERIAVAQSIAANVEWLSRGFPGVRRRMHRYLVRGDADPTYPEDVSFEDRVPSFAGSRAPVAFSSTLCRADHFRMPLYQYWCSVLGEKPRYRRKQWEYVFICQVLHERGCLAPGKRAIGFGVGREPLAALFASRGVSVLASDQDSEGARGGGWSATNQHSSGLADLNVHGVCDPGEFARLVSFRHIDMNDIPGDLGSFDFCWSACAFEHLGSIRRGIDFVRNACRLLKPGGIGVHTTEFNLGSNERTLESESLAIYRRRDIEQLVEELREDACDVEAIDYFAGEDRLDRYVDVPPYREDLHLRLELAGEFTATSIGLIVRKWVP
jgi:glycosyltransferase involved in cell wall biosynthesis/SAM-dependent methyltransferase